MTIPRRAALLFAAAAFCPTESSAQSAAATAAHSYADLADLAVAAPVAIDARIRSAIRLKDAQAAGVPAGQARFYVEADVLALIRGRDGSPGSIAYVADVALDARGKPPKLKKARVLLLARPVANKPGTLQLVSPAAQLLWTAALDAELRAIIAEAASPGAAPRITGVGSAFNVPGAVPGESETQIFLTTAQGQPVSISVIRRPGEAPRWAVALGEIVDEAAGPPAPRTLLWYRLACSLPVRLPAASLDGIEPARADVARADYRIVIEGLGPCGRTRTAQSASLPR